MANRWERGKLGPYTLPNDFTTGGVKIAGISSVDPPEVPYLMPTASAFFVRSFDAIADNTDFLICSGQAVSRTTYSDLFDEIGTTYGVGDGSTTFNVPFTDVTFQRCAGTAAASGVGQFQESVISSHSHTCATLPGANFTFEENQNFAINLNGNTLTNNNCTLSVANIQSNLPRQSVKLYGPGLFASNEYGQITSSYAREFICMTTKNTSLPVGGIVPFIGSDSLEPLGSNFLFCNGQTVSAATYPKAAAVLITTCPDFRGFFVMGTYGNKAAREDQHSAHHTHSRTHPSDSNTGSACIFPSGIYNQINLPGSGGSGQNGPNPRNVSSTAFALGPGLETRPLNMNVNYFMRVN
jgi:microcystin-dependent protein